MMRNDFLSDLDLMKSDFQRNSRLIPQLQGSEGDSKKRNFKGSKKAQGLRPTRG